MYTKSNITNNHIHHLHYTIQQEFIYLHIISTSITHQINLQCSPCMHTFCLVSAEPVRICFQISYPLLNGPVLSESTYKSCMSPTTLISPQKILMLVSYQWISDTGRHHTCAPMWPHPTNAQQTDKILWSSDNEDDTQIYDMDLLGDHGERV